MPLPNFSSVVQDRAGDTPALPAKLPNFGTSTGTGRVPNFKPAGPVIPHRDPFLVSTIGGGTTGGGLHLDSFTRNDLPDAESIRAVMGDVQRPAVPIPKFTIHPDDSKTVAVGKEAVNLLTGLPEFMESPLGIATAGAGGVLPRTIAGIFTATTLHDTGKKIIESHKDWDSYTPAQKAVAVTDIAGGTALSALLGRATAKGISRTAPPAKNGEAPAAGQRSAPSLPLDLTGLGDAMKANQLAPKAEVGGQGSEVSLKPAPKMKIQAGDIEKAINQFLSENNLPVNAWDNDQRLEIHNMIRATFGNIAVDQQLHPGIIKAGLGLEPFLGHLKRNGFLPKDWQPQVRDGFGSGLRLPTDEEAAKKRNDFFSKIPVTKARQFIADDVNKKSADDIKQQMLRKIKAGLPVPADHVLSFKDARMEAMLSDQGFQRSEDGNWFVKNPLFIPPQQQQDKKKETEKPPSPDKAAPKQTAPAPAGEDISAAKQPESAKSKKYPNTGVGSPADEYGAIYGPKLTDEQIGKFKEQEGNEFPIESPAGTTAVLKVKPNMLWLETDRQIGKSLEHEVGVAYLKIRSDGTTVLDASHHGRPIDKLAAEKLIDFLQKTKSPKQAKSPPPKELFPAAETPFNLAGEKAEFVAPKPEQTRFGDETLAQDELFAIQKVVEHKDPAKSTDAATALYGGTREAIRKIEAQLAVMAADPKSYKSFGKEQRQRLQDVLALLRQRSSATTGNRREAMGSAAPRPAPKAGSIQPPPQVAKLPVPKLGALDTWWQQHTLGFRRIFMPQTIDAGAAEVGNSMRELLGEKAIALQRAEQQMNALKNEFDWTPVAPDYVYDPTKPLPHNYAIIDALERSRGALPDRYQKFGEFLDREFAWRIDLIRQFAPNALQKLITDYFPHLWTDDSRAKGVMAQIATKHFEGAKEFLKQRSLPLFVDGLERGLKPVSDNPVDLLLAKMHSMDQFILSLKAQAQFKATGKLKFNYWAESPLDGHVRIDDPAFIVHAPPFVEAAEGFDESLRVRTVEGLNRLGIKTERLVSLGGKRWGDANEGTRTVRTKFGGDTWIFWHEMGHQMDFMYHDLRKALGLSTDQLHSKDVHDVELRALADLRLKEGDTGMRAKANPKLGKINPKTGKPFQVRKQTVNVRTSFSSYTRRAEEKMANVFHAYLHAPELFARTAPNVARALDGWLAQHPDVRGVLNDIRQPSLRLGVNKYQIPTAGPVLLGYWTMPDGAAQVIKNYLSPGLVKFKAFQNVRSASNLLNAAQLGFSGFHLGFTSLDATVNAVEVGMFQALRGDPLKGLATLMKAPIAPVANYYVGKAIRTAMLDPNATTMKVWGKQVKFNPVTHDYAALAVKAGLRATLDPFWKTHFSRGLVRALGQVRNAWEGAGSREQGVLRAAWAAKMLPLRAAAAFAEQAMRPIAEFLVPNQKLGVFSLLAKSELEKLEKSGTAARRPSQTDIQAALARAANATEDRMGQMTYDNLFYNRLAKDLALIGTRSYGWQFGKYRHLAGAVSDTVIGTRRLLGNTSAEALNKPSGITHRQLYFIALPMVLGAVGGILHYMWTGRRPKDMVDLLHPSTGQMDAYGNEKRVSLPSYWKDLESDWYGMRSGLQSGGPAGALKGLWDSTYQRANPWINNIVEMLRNKDFYGQQIYTPTDPLDKKVWEQLTHVATSFEPFSVSQSARLAQGESSTMDRLLPFIGIVPAKQALVQSPAQTKAGEIMRAMMPDVPQTVAEKQRSTDIAQIVRDIRTGKLNDEGQLVARMRGAGVGDNRHLSEIKQRVMWSPLEYQLHKMPLLEPDTGRDAMTVWDLMSDKEKVSTVQIFADKIQRSYQGGKLDVTETSRLVRLVMPYLKQAAAAARSKEEGVKPSGNLRSFQE